MKSLSLSCAMMTLMILSSALFWAQQSTDSLIDRQLPDLFSTYKMLHQAPELSHHEEKTSVFVAKQLRSLGFEVTDHFGKYDNPAWTAYGVVGVMKNGAGPTVLVRTELDALPIQEKTGLPYASHVKALDDEGKEVSVMHACGHDIHMTVFLGTARTLSEMKDRWRGTLIMIGQPAEETVNGAAAMLKGGLYSRFPKPDFAIALHDTPDLAAGQVGLTPGYALASSTSVDLTIHGIGGHGSAPQVTKDPIVVAAEVILALQTIVSREDSPFDPAVVTVGSIQAGSKNNIIPDEARLLLTVRTYKEEVRQRILASIDRIAKNIALAAGIPASLAPSMRVTEYTPATYNNPELTERLTNVFDKTLGASNVVRKPPIMASEDFGQFGLPDHQIPTCIYWLGAMDAARIVESQKTGTPLPSLHSSLFAPLPEPTIRTGVKVMTAAVLDLMKQ